MSAGNSFLPAEHIRATDALARLVDSLRTTGVNPQLQRRARTTLFDLLGVTVAGARSAEMQTLTRAWHPESGSTTPLGSTIQTSVSTAAELDAIASCMLELDEGNKYAAGHPAAHVVPAAIAATRLSTTPVDGHAFLAAVIAGYEVAARFGFALTRDNRWHTHGHWGATGAAAAASSIWNTDVGGIAAAIDSSTALIHVAPWAVVLDGNFSRNLWIGGAARAGIDAARLATAGLVQNRGTSAHTLGDIVGTLDADRLTDGLGERWLTLEGYSKQHASCSYTHAAVDTIQSLRAHAAWDAADVARVEVRTHSLAEPLFTRHPANRLGAMFSLPFVVAAAFVSDAIDVDALDPLGANWAATEAFSERVDVRAAPEFDAMLPRLRAAEVTVILRSGERISAATPNPIGDTDHFPMNHDAIHSKLTRLIGARDTDTLARVVDQIPESCDVAALLDGPLRGS